MANNGDGTMALFTKILGTICVASIIGVYSWVWRTDSNVAQHGSDIRHVQSDVEEVKSDYKTGLQEVRGDLKSMNKEMAEVKLLQREMHTMLKAMKDR